MTSTLIEKAVVGRRILFTYYRDLKRQDPAQHPGVITGRFPSHGAPVNVKLRLDGTRNSLYVPPNYQGLRYLDEIGPVPELPMGRFIPEASDSNGFYMQAGSLLAAIGEDGEELVIVTDDLAKAQAAATAWAKETGLDLDYLGLEDLDPRWVVFEWEPEDAECPWTVSWEASEGDDQAVHIYYLPAA